MTDGWLEAEAPAKVNLRLRIYPRAADGFHPLETIFCRVSFADLVRLRMRDEEGISIRVRGHESAPEGPDNLAVRAAALVLRRSGIRGGVELELEKRVPARSGLGGGSSDAATVLRTLNSAIERRLELERMLELACELGADVTFFTADLPLALGHGRGDRLTPLARIEARPMLILLPEIGVSTAQAYALWDEALEAGDVDEPGVGPDVEPERIRSWSDLSALAVNEFEPVVFRLRPALADLKRRLDATRPLFSLLSGSGSALFAVYENEERRGLALRELEKRLKRVRLISAHGPV